MDLEVHATLAGRFDDFGERGFRKEGLVEAFAPLGAVTGFHEKECCSLRVR
jgi:hypothetical protein